ncbi:MAG: aminoacyl-tRNA hydrolase, partial [Gammaproteobacteria bacterium]
HADDRHNAGYWFVEALASEFNLQWRDESRYKGEFARAQSGIRFLKPSTFMNLSGESVAACANYFRIPVAGILIVHDELDLEPGVVRLKRG